MSWLLLTEVPELLHAEIIIKLDVRTPIDIQDWYGLLGLTVVSISSVIGSLLSYVH